MLFIPQKGRVMVEHNTGAVGAASIGTAVTTGASASTKTSPAVQLIASTSFDAYMIQIFAGDYSASATASEAMLDIMIGSATEEMLIPNLLVGYAPGTTSGNVINAMSRSFCFPLYIPAGSRIAAATAGARVSTAIDVAVFLYGGHAMPGFRVGTKVISYPTAPSVPRGQAITPGQSGAEPSAWTEIVASTSEDHFAILPSFSSETLTTVLARNYSYDIGIGAATAEEEIAQGYWFAANTTEAYSGPFPNFPTFVDIPSGTRLSARVSNSGTNDAAYGTMLHCVS